LLTDVAEKEKSASLAEAEQKILKELMEVVQQRDALVALLEEDRLKSVYSLCCALWQTYSGHRAKFYLSRVFDNDMLACFYGL